MKKMRMMTGILGSCLNTMVQWGGQNEEQENEEQEGEENASHEPDDELRRVIVDAQRGCKSEREKLEFNHMLEDHKKGCTQTAKRETLELLQWKAEYGMPDKGF